ncbi:hypothetical protein [Picrophilus oshimae]|uniref:Uncharacterized protein n=1 Tax=Picrophilus torridus (strain ATCC 700027 / DSM 9790 / JCM 10055 / NBRC 100828 / KAW 2/3) TaxID=1122961 RepID=Q6L168_PICTO|nr:hypothetical protein [Picrophilus oshimae]AAT43284.1 hypothetical protein PTO0699 [Picrophilus oshimae DSM 9789]
MVKTFDVNSLSERKRFELKLQIALLNNALKIQSMSPHPEKYDEYINERHTIIRSILNTTADFIVKDGDNILYKSFNEIMDKNSK